MACYTANSILSNMKTLSNKIIIYDDVCPLCKAYTNSFVNLGWLLPDHRVGFSSASSELLASIDLDRARHEIPLYDTQTKETLYGKEALFFILGEEFPVFKPLFKLSLFRFLIHGLYQIITYNRRIIAGSKAPISGFDCAPDFNGFYRWLYISLTALVSLLIGLANINVWTTPIIGFLIVIGIGIIRSFFIKNFIKKTDYYGHLTTVLLVMNIIAMMAIFSGLVLSILVPLGAYWLAWRLR